MEILKEILWTEIYEGVEISFVKTEMFTEGNKIEQYKFTTPGIGLFLLEKDQAIIHGLNLKKTRLKDQFYKYLILKGIDSIDKLQKII